MACTLLSVPVLMEVVFFSISVPMQLVIFFVVRGAVCTAAVARTAVNIRGQSATAAVSPGVSTLLRGFWARACEEVPFR